MRKGDPKGQPALLGLRRLGKIKGARCVKAPGWISGAPCFATGLQLAGYSVTPASVRSCPARALCRALWPPLMVSLAVVVGASSGEAAAQEAQEPSQAIEVLVEDEDNAAAASQRQAGEHRLDAKILRAAPRSEGAEVLRSAPGLHIGRGEGASVAHHYMLRGFDSEHGQDIEFQVGGIPINLPSHIHGQGYADLGFLIGGLVQEMQVRHGIYSPEQGDFAVAGSIGLRLGVPLAQRGLRLSGGLGSWGSFEQSVMWAPQEASLESFVAARYGQTRGFGSNRAGRQASAIAQHRFSAQDWSLRLLGVLYGSRSSMAGVLRRDDIDQGKIGALDVYPFATARGQGASAQRIMLGLFADYRAEQESRGSIAFYFSSDRFRLLQNFSGFIEQSRVLERVGGRGDLIEQRNRTVTTGLRANYRAPTIDLGRRFSVSPRVGIDGRVDLIEQKQNLVDAAVRNQIWDRRVEASVAGLDLGSWAGVELKHADWLRLTGSIRANLLSYEVSDELGNFAPKTRPQDQFIQGFQRSALGMAWSPRANLWLRANSWLSLLAAYGQGYRSPQARTLEDGEDAPFTKVHSSDLGMRMDWGAPFRLGIDGFYTELSSDVAFEASEGRLERIGASRRTGASLSAQTQLSERFVGALSMTYVHAILLEPPPPSAQEPFPPFVEGQHLPFVPPFVARLDLGLREPLFRDRAGRPLVGQLGVGVSGFSSRPLPFQQWAKPVALLDLSATLSWRRLELGVDFFNVLNHRYAAVEYFFPSDWSPQDGARSRVPSRHQSAGAPFSYFVRIGATL